MSRWKLTGCEVLPKMHAMRSKPPANGHSNPVVNGASGKPTDRHYGRFQTLNHFVDFTMSKLSRAEVAVWMILFRDTKKDGTACVAQADMARRAGADDRTMRRALRRLIGLRLVSVVRQGGLGRGPSTYRVNTNPPSW